MMTDVALADDGDENDSADVVEIGKQDANSEAEPGHNFTLAGELIKEDPFFFFSSIASDPSILCTEIDAIMYLALLQSLAIISKQSDSLPIPVSSLYSSQILPNRPAHWPPREARGRRTSRLPLYLIVVEEDDTERLVNPDTVDIKHTSVKKLAKWIKAAEKGELLKCKEVKGKDMVVTWINSSHKE